MDKKARKKKEREEKKRQQRKLAARSPLEKLEAPAQNLRALVNADWNEQGLADLIVRRDLSAGELAIAFFKVSLDVGGLSVAQGYLDATEEDWSNAVADYSEAGKMVPCDLALLRTLVEGGARIASENGLRLPDRWEKWARIYGPPSADLQAADISQFDQGFYGPLSELKGRLTGYTLETFLARTDIDVNPEDDLGLFPEWAKAPEPDFSSLAALDDLDPNSIEAFLARTGETPHPDLELAIKLATDARFATNTNRLIDASSPADDAAYLAAIEQSIGRLPSERQAPVREALQQHARFLADLTNI